MNFDLARFSLGLPFLIVAAILVVGVFTFLYTREQAARSSTARKEFLRGGVVGVASGLLLAVGSWYVLPTNPESPAMLITYFMSWVVGGGLIFFSTLICLAAVTARPSAS